MLQDCPSLPHSILAQIFLCVPCGLFEQKGILLTFVRAHSNTMTIV